MATVVVIDDETMNADALAFLLSAEGIDVRTAADGKEGLELIADVRPAVVITDFMMPVMTGLELARALRSDPETAHIPVVLLSSAQAYIGRQHPDLFNAVFEKPCSPLDVLATVKRFLGPRD